MLVVGLLLVLALAATLRFSALGFAPDLPGARPDEAGVIEGLRALRDGQPFPSLVLYGGGFFYPLYGYVAVRSWVGGDSLLSLAADRAFAATLAVRSWSALLSTITVLLTFACTARLAGGAAGLLAGLLLAVTPLAVREAHFAKADSGAAFAVAVFLFVVVLTPRRPVARTTAVGVAAAFALSSKAVVGVIPAALLALARPVEARGRAIDWSALIVGGGAMLAATAAFNAFWLHDPVRNLELARGAARALSRTDWLSGSEVAGGPLAYHAVVSLRHGCGAFLAFAALPALAWGFARDANTRVVATFALVEWLKLVASPMVLARFFLPIVPALVVLSAVAMSDLVDRVGPLSRAMRAWLVVGLGIVVSAAPLAASMTMVRALGRDDTRSLAARWIDAELPRDAVIVTWGSPADSIVEWGVPPAGGRRVVRAALPDRWPRIRATHVLVHSYPLPHSNVAPPAEVSRLRRVAVFDPLDGPMLNPVLEPLDAFYLPLDGLEGFVRPGPRIEIYETERSTP